MKTYTYLIFTTVLFVQQIKAQFTPRVFGGADIYLSSEFNNRSYYNFQTGIEVFRIKFIAPEIAYEYFFGALNNANHIDEVTLIEDNYLRRKFNANTFSITPKLFYGKDGWRILVLPKYSWSKINAYGYYYETTDNGLSYTIKQEEEISENQNYFSLGIGLEAEIFETEKLSMMFSILYTGLNAGNTLSKLDFTDYGYGSASEESRTLGIGVKLYFNPFVKDTLQ